MTLTSIYFGDLKSSKDNTADIALNNSYDFSRPIRYNLTAANGRTFPVYALAAEATSKDTWTEADTQALLGMAGLFVDTYHQLYLTIDKINASRTEIGTYHPANADMLSTLGYWLGMSTAYFDLDEGEMCKVVARKNGIQLDTATGGVIGERSLDVVEGERMVVEGTREVYPGLYVCGMASSAVAGTPRMGPIFGGMMLSGKKVADMIIEKLKK